MLPRFLDVHNVVCWLLHYELHKPVLPPLAGYHDPCGIERTAGCPRRAAGAPDEIEVAARLTGPGRESALASKSQPRRHRRTAPVFRIADDGDRFQRPRGKSYRGQRGSAFRDQTKSRSRLPQPITDLHVLRAIPLVQTGAAEHLGFVAVKNAIYEIAALPEVFRETRKTGFKFKKGGRLGSCPWHPREQVGQAGIQSSF